MKKLLTTLSAVLLAVCVCNGLAVSAISPKSPFEGVWRLQREGKWDGSTLFTVAGNGDFSFAGIGWKSKGVSTTVEENLYLVWTEIDGEKVEPNTVRKTLSLTKYGNISINGFIYVKDR